MFVIVAVLVGLIPLVPAVIFSRDRRRARGERPLVVGLNGFNAIIG
jgi:hypothetical protein